MTTAYADWNAPPSRQERGERFYRTQYSDLAAARPWTGLSLFQQDIYCDQAESAAHFEQMRHLEREREQFEAMATERARQMAIGLVPSQLPPEGVISAAGNQFPSWLMNQNNAVLRQLLLDTERRERIRGQDTGSLQWLSHGLSSPFTRARKP